MIFKESKHAHKWLDGLKGIEVGGSAHNPFGLDTLNVDYTDSMDTEFKKAEFRVAKTVLRVDIVAWAWDIPVQNKSYDFVISSHVIEHMYDPIKTLWEWERIARKYIYLIVPQPDALPSDRKKKLTSSDELTKRIHSERIVYDPTEHYSRWRCSTFISMCMDYGFRVVDWLDPDDKVGNGFTIVIDVSR